MPLPPGTSTVTVTEDYVRPDGTVPAVIVRFELGHPMYVTDTTIVVDPVEYDLGVNGALSAVLAALPDDYWYRVTQIIDGRREVRNIPLPASPAAVILHEVGDVDPIVPGIIRVISVDGILPGPDGNIELPGTGGGVASVNDQLPDGSGNVELTAAHVGALTQAAADVRYVQPATLDGYATDSELTTGLGTKANTAHTHAQGDVTGLAGALAAKADLVAGKIPQAQLPAVALVDYLGQVASEAAMLALTGQRGDWTDRTDLGTTWQLIADDPTQLASWQEHTYPDSPVQSVAGRTGAVVLTKTDVGLGAVDNTSDANKPISTATQVALDGKEPVGAAASAIAAHVAAGDPHTQYLTATEGNALYAAIEDLADKEDTGVAAALVAAHEAAGDPHSQYLTQAEADALYATLAALAAKARKPVVRQAYVTSGNIQLNTGTNTWGPLTGSPTLAIPAAAGDWVELDVNALRQANANIYLDVGVLVAGAIVRYLATGSSTPAGEGDPGLYPAALPARSGARGFTAASGDLSGGNVTFSFAIRNLSGASSLLLADTAVPLCWRAMNYGPVD